MTRAAFVIPGDLSLPTGGYAYDRQVLARLPGLGVDVLHVALPGGYPQPSTKDLAATREAIAALEADRVLLIDGLAYGAMPAELVAGFHQPIVALCHHPLALEAGIAPALAQALHRSERAALALARHVIATSVTTARILIHDFAVPASAITIAEPGTAPAVAAVGSADAGGGPLKLLSVGSIVPRKAYDVLVRALAMLPAVGSAGLDWQLTIAGAVRSEEARAVLDTAIAETGLAGRVSRVGAVSDDELAALYHRADIFVLPSLFEGYGMVLTEAMARGLPIICTTGGAAAETCPDAAALKVAPGDANALAAALRAVMADPVRRAGMRAASLEAGRVLPTWDETTTTIARVLKSVGALTAATPAGATARTSS